VGADRRELAPRHPGGYLRQGSDGSVRYRFRNSALELHAAHQQQATQQTSQSQSHTRRDRSCVRGSKRKSERDRASPQGGKPCFRSAHRGGLVRQVRRVPAPGTVPAHCRRADERDHETARKKDEPQRKNESPSGGQGRCRGRCPHHPRCRSRGGSRCAGSGRRCGSGGRPGGAATGCPRAAAGPDRGPPDGGAAAPRQPAGCSRAGARCRGAAGPGSVHLPNAISDQEAFVRIYGQAVLGGDARHMAAADQVWAKFKQTFG